ncbi:DUF6249 domain-containing protein [Mucilaginibacter arboris]|uniref:DUF6249 domain-containing protein n=1 Tax=Mucilaginibacter arboris TaxID=2682090 RepID=A0A7K1SS28_9SPHI|nr:DUF6249 domain-containing protein [Mucilaginibacter arboris]MVN20122.1 hypothetical protein [Mucilaginibacter arboris]
MSQSQLALLIPILVPLALFALIFGIIYLRNKERMAMIERGMEPDNRLPRQRQSNPAFSLTFGLLLIGSGLGLFIAYMIDHFALSDENSPAIYFSLIAFFGGLGLFVSYLIERKANQKKEL